MSATTFVPETRDLDGDDAQQTMRRVGVGCLLSRSSRRFRAADGSSHARSLGWVITLVMLQGIIAAVGFATALGQGEVANVIARTIDDVVPGPAGETLQTTLDQAAESGSSHRYTALIIGTVSAIVTATTGFGQVERAANRMYGVESDRPSVQKYARALGLTFTAGVAVAFGGAISVVAWILVSVGMALFLRWSGTFGETYGPLAGVVALLAWSNLSAIALLAGLAVTAQLEAERVGVDEPDEDEAAAPGDVRRRAWSAATT